VFNKLNFPQQKPVKNNGKVEAMIQLLCQKKILAEKLLKTSLKVS